MTPQPRIVARRLLPWFHRHGRRDLPWQHNPTPYRVWVSEVMLQQTQVATVIPYYRGFLSRFPDVGALAAAHLDDVLRLWAGLGYYARGRNLHRAARAIVERHGGQLPRTLDEWMALPGVGRSTAGAIMALAHGLRHPILDGNAKRVLARLFLVREPADEASAALWELAERCTPRTRVAEYTQAIMDLGATLCTRARPACDRCPLQDDCGARAAGLADELPARRRRRERKLRRTHMVFVHSGGRVLLHRRPPSGIWGGLWSPPEFADARAARRWCDGFGADASPCRLPVLRHSFTHFELDISPWVLEIPGRGHATAGREGRWITPAARARLGLPAPVARLLASGLSGHGAKESADGENGALRAARTRGGRPRSRAVPRGAGPAHP